MEEITHVILALLSQISYLKCSLYLENALKGWFFYCLDNV